jgi:hypothetical protein
VIVDDQGGVQIMDDTADIYGRAEGIVVVDQVAGNEGIDHTVQGIEHILYGKIIASSCDAVIDRENSIDGIGRQNSRKVSGL